jgi:acylphosphatase
VRNRSDGTVEALVEGPRGALTRFVAWCHHGPPAARVERVDTTWAEPTGSFDSFQVQS